MKKFIAIAAAIVLFGTQAFAQLSVGAGYLNSTEISKVQTNDGTKKYTQDLNGFYAGANYTFGLDALVDGLAITPGAYASMLFGVNKDNSNTTYQDLTVNIPVNISYGFNLTSDFKLMAFVGPIFQIGVINKTITKTSNQTNTRNNFEADKVSASIDLGSLGVVGGEATLVPARERFNILLGGGLGFEVNEQIAVLVGYNHSLMNYWKRDNTTVGRSQITVGVNFKF